MSATIDTERRVRHPARIPPRGLSRVDAAEYIGISPTKFDEMVKDGRMPPPKTIDARKVWDVRKLDVAFDALPSPGDDDRWVFSV